MPEFVLDLSDASDEYYSLDPFTQGYIEALFFTNTGSLDDGGLRHATFADLSPQAIGEIVAECTKFQRANADLLAVAYHREGYDAQAAGRDFWFTSNGHGVGFWDRKALEADDLGSDLSDTCGFHTSFPGHDVYRGDDGRIYLGPAG
jgi:hypothetical protein